ncbi:putative RNA-directed DNA polymerase, eukaryota, reverse transcriptase zinc-binding domain protein [Tanacetum coccineum]
MEVLLGIHGVGDVVDRGLADVKKNNIAKGLLFQTIPVDLVLQIGNLKIAKEMWEAIKIRNLGVVRVKEARLQTLITEFKNSKMSDNGTIDEYATNLSVIASKSTTLGEVMSEHKLVKKFLTSLPRQRVKEEDKANDAQENLLYARTEYSNGNNNSSRGRGHGSYSRGRGQGSGYMATLKIMVNVPRSANRLYKTQLKVGKEDSKQASKEPRTFTVVWDERYEEAEQIWGNENTVLEAARHEWPLTGHDNQAGEILKEVGMKDCNATLCPMEPGLKLSKAKDEPEVEATQYRKVVGCLRYLLHTRPDLTYSVAEFMAATAAACQAIWLRELLAEVTGNKQVIVEDVSRENQRADPLTKALARIRFKEMRSLLGVQELPFSTQKFRG